MSRPSLGPCFQLLTSGLNVFPAVSFVESAALLFKQLVYFSSSKVLLKVKDNSNLTSLKFMSAVARRLKYLFEPAP